MATESSRPWYILMLLATLWPLKVICVYFLNCACDVSTALVREWKGRKRRTGWER